MKQIILAMAVMAGGVMIGCDRTERPENTGDTQQTTEPRTRENASPTAPPPAASPTTMPGGTANQSASPATAPSNDATTRPNP